MTDGYTPTRKALHWLVAVLVVVQAGFGLLHLGGVATHTVIRRDGLLRRMT
jgi:cytochrome b561